MSGQIEEFTEEQIIQALQRSGYLMEQEVAGVLQERGYYVTPNEGFVDPDTGTAREYDLHAMGAITVAETRSEYVFPVLLVECRKSDRPLVLLTGDRILRAVLAEADFDNYYSGYPKHIYGANGESDDSAQSLFDFLDLSRCHHYWTCERMSTQFAEIVRDGKKIVARHEMLYNDAIVPLIKALRFEAVKDDERMSAALTEEQDASNIQVYWPVVVWRGAMFQYYAAAEPPKLEQATHVNFIRRYRSETIDGTFHVDIVAEEYLPDYLNMVDQEIKSIANLFRRHRAAIKRSIEIAADRKLHGG